MFELSTITLLAATEAEEKTGIAVLGIDPKAILLQAGTFLILFFLIKKFALDKIVAQLEQRRQTIDKGVDLGIAMEGKKAEFDEQLKKMQHEARKQADEILASAHAESGEILKESQETASRKVDQMLKDAEARIEREMQDAQKALRKEMLSLVAEATEVVIEEKLDAKKDASLIERALGRIKA